MINVRELAAIEMLWLGSSFVLIEYVLGILLPLAIGAMFLGASAAGVDSSLLTFIAGLWLVCIAINYVPLLIYALQIAQSGTAAYEGQLESGHAKRFTIQQAIILVPFLVVIAAVMQELRRS